MPPGLKRLAQRQGDRPRFEPKWPCLQTGDTSRKALRDALVQAILEFEGVSACQPPFDAPGTGFALIDDLARGQPEAFVNGTCWLVLQPGGAMHLSLRPEWAQKVVNHGWATVHPFARYMAGAVPPQSLVVYAPRDRRELAVAIRIAAAAHSYAMGRIGDLILPDTRW
ncbi:hypothetical protein GR167_19645 [Rhodobacteraceae bacterium GS-10]|uniref:Luciferase domain-containing protein n=2 Tax=Thalassovita mangrovi TaxID=2692236 RepID=A0A6L8LSD3_9RHOB|nr:hypothetical protein [Thalassovita mangrovi]